ncbi:Pvstp1 [Plasmodium coatneyi]|uniref:Pvstp1 n=1 Tax=Plasmodium coatneyi TaxID=208452 RepID=A0A1B1E6J5_9APIC|nr:Pvstp1 [Plasmodium coatneyi]ANQ10603.1 Pvstp1 [Plasmodium coatneyi]
MQDDINEEATKMFNKISEDSSKDIPDYCSNLTLPTSRIVTDPERRTCQYITAGLKHIYGIEEGKGEGHAKDNRSFKQTMLCLVLNDYADKLQGEVKSPCKVGEDTIRQAFTKGNEKINDWCFHKGPNGKGDCVQCDRYDKYAECEIGDGQDKEEVGPKLEELFKNNIQKSEIQKTLTTISSINNLCERSQCVITQWARDRRTGSNTSAAWDDAKGNILKELSEAMTTNSKTEEDECKDFQGKDGSDDVANKKVCNYIVKGLKHIYSITEDLKGTTDQRKKNYRIFKQTMGSLILNEYGKLLGEQSCIEEQDVQKVFTGVGNLHIYACTEKSCDQCNWDPCSNFIIGQEDTKRKEIKKRLEKNEDIKKTLDAISDLCKQPAKPATAAKPAATKPSGSEDHTSSGAVQTNPGTSGPTQAKDGAEGPDKPSSSSTSSTTQHSGDPSASGAAGGGGARTILPKLGPGENGRLPSRPSRRVVEKEGVLDPSDLLTPYLPTIPVFLGISAMTYLLWKYFGMLRKTRKRYKRARQITGPTLQEQIIDHVDDQVDGPHAYTLVKERKRRSTPKKRRKKCSGRRMIIDIHLEVLDECQRGDVTLTKEDYFTILVQEFMGIEFIKKDFVPKEEVSMVDVPKESVSREVVPKEQVPSLDSGFREENSVPKEDITMEQVPCSNSEFSENVFSQTTYWVNWIEKNKAVLEEIKTQPWFYDLKVSWREHQREHADRSELNDDNNFSFEEKRKEFFRSWVRKQHALMELNSQTADWFKHLLGNMEELEPEQLEQQELCQKSHKKNRLAAKLWMLILALLFEECGREENVCNKELYLDHLLQSV